MSGSLNSFRANIDASFGNLDKHQFHALFEEVLKEKAKRLIGEEALNTNMSWHEVSLTADLRLSSGHCAIVATTWDLRNKDMRPWGGEQYNPQVIRGMDYRKGCGPPIPTGIDGPPILMPNGTRPSASGAICFGGW